MHVQVNDTVESYSTPENCYHAAVRGRVIALTETHACVQVQAVIDPNAIDWRVWRGAPFTATIQFNKLDPSSE